MQFDEEFLKNGLTQEEAARRLVKNGKNVISSKKKISPLVRFALQFGDFMVIILMISAAISVVLGFVEKSGSEMVDGLVIFAIVLFNAFFGFIQENKAIASIESLQKMTGNVSHVRRNGEIIKINSEDLVVGDVLVLEAGTTLSADVVLTESHSLMIDESAFTGESVPVQKDHTKVSNDSTAIGDRLDQAFSGTHVAYGRGEGVVIACGNHTHIGKIASLVQSEIDEKTPLEKSIASIGKVITFIVLGVAVLIFLAEMLLKPNPNFIEAFMTAVAISVAAIPESLPAVITIIMALGVTRLAKQKAIVKKLHAVETLGCCEVICSDKTGTLTQNVMTVIKLFANDAIYEEEFEKSELDDLLRTMVLCNDAEESKGSFIGDPTEIALLEFAQTLGFQKDELELAFKRTSEIPFDSNRKLMTTLNLTNDQFLQHTKGGVDEVLSKCSHILLNGKIKPLTQAHIESVKKANESFASQALRVLAFAIKKVKSQEDRLSEQDMIFVGLSGMIDPPRKEVKLAVEKCKKAGMRAIMITGDHKHTAFAIAKEIGIAQHESEVITGQELDELSEEQLVLRIDKLKVFARVSPNHKVQIVKAFKRLGKVVAMTGDGVNDAPAIKSADIGVGMGITGTDITKEAADIIISDDNFATIVLAVEEGRKIYQNIQKTVQYLLTTNFAEIFSLLIATLLFPQFVFLYPLQILFVNLVTDSLPAIALGVENTEKSLMKNPPRDANKNIFAGGVGINILVQGLFQTAILLFVFFIGLLTSAQSVAITMVFYALNIIQLLHLLSVRTKGSVFASNPFQNKIVIAAMLVNIGSILLLALTPIGKIFKVVQLNASQWLIVLLSSGMIVVFNEIYRLILKAVHRNKKAKNA